MSHAHCRSEIGLLRIPECGENLRRNKTPTRPFGIDRKERLGKIEGVFRDQLPHEGIPGQALRFRTGTVVGRRPGAGEKIALSVLDFFKNSYNNELLQKLEANSVIPEELKREEGKDTFAGLTFVITGTLSKPRDSFEKIIKQHGGKVSSSVSKKTAYVLLGEAPGSKFDKARELGVKIINEKEFDDLLGEN